MIIVSHPNGNQNVRSVLNALYEEGILHTYYTAFGLAQDDFLLRLLPARQRRQIQRRAYALPAKIIRRHPAREVTRLVAPKLKMSKIARSPDGWASIEWVYWNLDATVAGKIPSIVARNKGGQRAVTGVYCYQDGALRTHQAARQQGLKCFYDLPTAYCDAVEKLLGEEGERYPEWKFSIQSSLSSESKLENHRQEVAGADAIFVPSRFVYDTLPQSVRDTKQVTIAEFGSPLAGSSAVISKIENTREPLRVLFVGRMSQRKGLADVFEAMRLLNRSDVELVVLGTPQAPIEKYKNFYPNFRFEQPRPHAEVLQMMSQCDVFVFPSIVEGRALVQQEALSQGLPLIVTKNAGAEDVIEEGKTGFLVPIRSPEIIAERINWFADNRALLPEMRELARQKAAEYTWQRYGKIVVDAIRDNIA